MADDKSFIISGEQVANYVVCPEAWRLKYVERKTYGGDAEQRVVESRRLRRAWVADQDLSSRLRAYAKIVYLLTVAVVIIVFLLDIKQNLNRRSEVSQINGVASSSADADISPPLLHKGKAQIREFVRRTQKTIPTEITLLLLIVGLLIFLWDLFERRSAKLRSTSGLQGGEIISVKGSERTPATDLYSARLGLVSKPDAVIRLDDALVPVDIKPMTNKVRDRHVVTLLLHMKLIEEIEGRRPPYGILLMGSKKRQVKIAYSAEKQIWLESLLDEMRSILDGIPAVPSPAPFKCRNCDVKEICSHRVTRQD